MAKVRINRTVKLSGMYSSGETFVFQYKIDKRYNVKKYNLRFADQHMFFIIALN